MNSYLNFFSPQTVSVLYCLYQACKAGQSPESTRLTQFAISKIISTNQQPSCSSNQQFQAQLLSVTDQPKFLTLYHTTIESINNLNDFYRFLSTTLKNLRMLRNNKAQQSGNIVELFVRRLGVYFQKLDFHELVGIFNEFTKYKQGVTLKKQVNDFAVSRRLEEIKFGLENYSGVGDYQVTRRQLEGLGEFDHHFKAFYLRALNEAEGGRPLDSTDSLHKYFDKSLCNLFQERTENSQQVNNVNHCILSLAYMNLRLGFIDESLKSISQGLRISQNNTDQQSINHCIIYLYQITSNLGMYRQNILLTQHAITHCLNLNNTLLMLYSCLAYSQLQKRHDCSIRQLDPHKSRSLSWTDALHFAKKKIYSNFENSCKTIFHTERNLTIPVFLHKLAVVEQIPQLQGLMMDGFREDQQVNKLDKYKLAMGRTRGERWVGEAVLCDYRGEGARAKRIVQELEDMAHYLRQPEQIIRIWSFRNTILIHNLFLTEAYNSCHQLILFCRSRGFVKSYLLDQQLNLIHIHLIANNYFQALTLIQSVCSSSSQYQLTEHYLRANILKAQVHSKLGNVSYPVNILKKVEECGELANVKKETQGLFYEVKWRVFQKIVNVLLGEDMQEDAQQLARQIEQFQNKSIKLQLEMLNFREVSRQCKDILQSHCVKHPKAKNLEQTIEYLEQVFKYMAQLNVQYAYNQHSSAELSNKIRAKVELLLGL